MPSLHELQRDFLAVMLRRRPDEALRARLQRRGDLDRRIAVYKGNAIENFALALEAAFPVLEAQLGRVEFRAMAWSYQRRHPSRSGNLFGIGRALPGFLAATLRGTEHAWLGSLARLEWLVQESMVAADDDSRFDPHPLATLAEEHYGALRFRLHPAVRLARLDHPCFAAWQAFHEGRAPPPPPPAQAECLLVRRADEGIELHQLESLAHDCLVALGEGQDLAQLVDRLEQHPGAPDPGALLAGWAADGIIIGAILPGDGGG